MALFAVARQPDGPPGAPWTNERFGPTDAWVGTGPSGTPGCPFGPTPDVVSGVGSVWLELKSHSLCVVRGVFGPQGGGTRTSADAAGANAEAAIAANIAERI